MSKHTRLGNTIVAILFLILFPFMARAQEMRVKSFRALTNSTSATAESRLDRNDKPCALVKVRFADPGATFSGSVMGDVQYDGIDYWVYMPAGTKMLQVKHPDYVSLMVNFPEQGVKQLLSNETYLLQIEGVRSNAEQLQEVTIRIIPTDALLMVDGDDVEITNGTAVLRLPIGTHTFNAVATGYMSQTGTIKVENTSPGELVLELKNRTVKSNQNADTASSSVSETSAFGGHEYVDLGLPSGTLWATCNVGATKPEEFGDYFAWGETKAQGDKAYSWESYKWCKGREKTMTKYCSESEYGSVDRKRRLEAADDAATANWGEMWCVPTQKQLKELFSSYYTIGRWTRQNGISGYKITSKANGRSIFLPAAGSYSNGTDYNTYSQGNYWSSDMYYSGYGYNAVISSRGCGAESYEKRYVGFSIRPVVQ